MDCDGRRQLLITDEDGSFSGGNAGDTIISKAEYEWGGNPSFGLGKYNYTSYDYYNTTCFRANEPNVRVIIYILYSTNVISIYLHTGFSKRR